MKVFETKGVVFGEGIPVIAVPVLGKDESEILDAVSCAAASKAQGGAQVLEIRIDGFEGVHDTERIVSLLSKIENEFTGPLLFTLRTKREGGLLECDEALYGRILTAAICSGCINLVDIEMAFANAAKALLQTAHQNEVKVILSQHDFKSTPDTENICAALLEMQDMGADIAKCAYMPAEPEANGSFAVTYNEDVDRVLAAGLFARKNLDIPYLLISMGEAGQISRTYGEVFGSCMTFAALSGKGSAPGQIDDLTMKELLAERHRKMSENGSVFLIGFMGAGKSTVAAGMSQATGALVVEMDSRIEEEQGMTISEIFSLRGQDYFRDLETELLVRLTDEPPAVVSCGGGTVLRAVNVVLMRSMGRIILLEVSPEEVIRRLQKEASGRPNLKDRFSHEGVRKLHDARRQAYERAADETIVTDGKSVEEIVHFALATLPFLL